MNIIADHVMPDNSITQATDLGTVILCETCPATFVVVLGRDILKTWELVQ